MHGLYHQALHINAVHATLMMAAFYPTLTCILLKEKEDNYFFFWRTSHVDLLWKKKGRGEIWNCRSGILPIIIITALNTSNLSSYGLGGFYGVYLKSVEEKISVRSYSSFHCICCVLRRKLFPIHVKCILLVIFFRFFFFSFFQDLMAKSSSLVANYLYLRGMLRVACRQSIQVNVAKRSLLHWSGIIFFFIFWSKPLWCFF